MTKRRQIVAVVNDDPRMLESLVDLLESGGYAVRDYPSAAALLRAGLSGIDAVVTNAVVPGTDDQTPEADRRLPVFFITDRPEATGTERRHASDGFFRKSFDATALLDAIANALGKGKTGG